MTHFKDIAVGATFGLDKAWTKRTKRTAFNKNLNRIFYFRQNDYVTA